MTHSAAFQIWTFFMCLDCQNHAAETECSGQDRTDNDKRGANAWMLHLGGRLSSGNRLELYSVPEVSFCLKKKIQNQS